MKTAQVASTCTRKRLITIFQNASELTAESKGKKHLGHAGPKQLSGGEHCLERLFDPLGLVSISFLFAPPPHSFPLILMLQIFVPENERLQRFLMDL